MGYYTTKFEFPIRVRKFTYSTNHFVNFLGYISCSGNLWLTTMLS